MPATRTESAETTAVDLDLERIARDFDRDGFVVLRDFFSSREMQEVYEECDRLLAQTQLIDMNNRNLRTRIKQTRTTVEGKTKAGANVIERFDPVQDISPVFKRICNHPKLHRALKATLGDDALLFKDKLIFKLPGTPGYSLHSDSHQWEPFPCEDIVSVMLAIDAADADNGALELFPGYHKWLQVPMKAMGGHGRMLAERIDLNAGQMVETRPGDVILFHSRTPHRSGDNTSERSRRQYYPTYSAARHGNLYMGHYDHVHQLQRAARPGETLYLR